MLENGASPTKDKEKGVENRRRINKIACRLERDSRWQKHGELTFSIFLCEE
jgi:hypothetical protein